MLDVLPPGTLVLCDVRNPLLGERGAARVFGPQKGASPQAVEELERRLAGMRELAPFAELPGAGAAGGLGAALAALGGELVPGAAFVLERIGFFERLRGVALAVTGRAPSTPPPPRKGARGRWRGSARASECAAPSSRAASGPGRLRSSSTR